MCIKDQSIGDLEFFMEHTEFSISKEDNVKFRLFGKVAKFDMGFKISSSPEWIRDEGTGSIEVQDFNITMELVPESDNGKLKLNFLKDKALIDVGYLKSEFHGQTEIIESFQLITEHFESFFKQELVNIIGIQLGQSAEQSINRYLEETSNVLPAGDEGIYLNVSLTQSPIIENGYISTPFDGTWMSSKSEVTHE